MGCTRASERSRFPVGMEHGSCDMWSLAFPTTIWIHSVEDPSVEDHLSPSKLWQKPRAFKPNLLVDSGWCGAVLLVTARVPCCVAGTWRSWRWARA